LDLVDRAHATGPEEAHHPELAREHRPRRPHAQSFVTVSVSPLMPTTSSGTMISSRDICAAFTPRPGGVKAAGALRSRPSSMSLRLCIECGAPVPRPPMRCGACGARPPAWRAIPLTVAEVGRRLLVAAGAVVLAAAI